MPESHYVQLEYEKMPCYHEISFDAAKPALVIKVHKDFTVSLPSGGSRLSESFLKTFKFQSFQPTFFGDTFGFNGCFKKTGVQDRFLVFSADIPQLEIFIMQPCSYCQGHKKDLLFGGECLVCYGSGKEHKMKPCYSCTGIDLADPDCYRCHGKRQEPDSWMNHDSLYAISATLSVFFSLMWFGRQTDKFVESKIPQLLFVETSSQKEMGGCPIHGVLGIPLVEWLRKFPPDSHFRDVEEGMRIIWDKIHGERGFSDIDKMNTWCQVQKNGWLSISCPGDRTGIHPAYSYGLREGQGYEFHCHNVDNARQQLTLLAALAMLCDKARKETVM